MKVMEQSIKSKVRGAMAWGYYISKHFLSYLRGKVLILTYHRVLPESKLNLDFVQPGMYVRDDAFKRQMQFLQEHFQILPFSELLSIWDRRGLDKRERYCVITFDDGWLDNYIHAYPVLKMHNIPATVFLPTEFIGTQDWFWPDRLGYLLSQYRELERKEPLVSLWSRYPWMNQKNGEGNDRIDSLIDICKGLPEEEIKEMIEEISRESGISCPPGRLVVNWGEVEEMSASGVSFGSHSATHKILTKLSPEEIQNELNASFKALQREKVNTVPVFCYPNGNFNHAIAEKVKEAGYQAAVTTQFGFESASPANLFELRRVGVHNSISSTIPLFSWHLSGLNHLFPR